MNKPDYTKPTDSRCPVCRKPGHWRNGVGFEGEKRCPKCDICWTPGEPLHPSEVPANPVKTKGLIE